jgi:flagellar motor protein MotB
VRETSQEDAVEISRPYNPAATTKRPDFSRPSKPAGSSFSLLRKLSYWVVVLAVLALAAFGIKGLLVPATTEPEATAPTAQLPSLPEFNTVYRHSDDSRPGEDNFNVPEATPAPAPQAATEQSLAQITAPPAPATEPAPNQVALSPIPAQEATQPTTPISAPQPVDRGLESINRILPALFDLSGCSINSSNNEIRIVFQEGIFSSGVNIGSQGRTQLARVAEFLNANAPDFWVIIEGQTDSGKVRAQSPFRDNFTLGLRRAIEATTVMREEGNFPADRLLASSAGGFNPPFPENQPGAAARNRTVVLRLVPKTSPLPAQNQ